MVSERKYKVSRKIGYLEGKYCLKNMDSYEKVSLLDTFNDNVLKDIIECAQHILARRNGKECHVSDF